LIEEVRGSELGPSPVEKADEAYALMASGKSGKVTVVFDEELK
jgi:hypothetical protein